jgi:hypothetical protein
LEGVDAGDPEIRFVVPEGLDFPEDLPKVTGGDHFCGAQFKPQSAQAHHHVKGILKGRDDPADRVEPDGPDDERVAWTSRGCEGPVVPNKCSVLVAGLVDDHRSRHNAPEVIEHDSGEDERGAGLGLA